MFQKESLEKSSQKRMQIQLCTINPLETVQVAPPTKIQQVKKIVKKTTINKKITQQPKIIKQLTAQKKQIVTTAVTPTTTIENRPSTPTIEIEKEKSLQSQQEYLNKHLKEITKLLSDNLYYPRSARKRGITDVVVVKFTLSRLGEVHSLQIIESKTKILSRAAEETINNLSGQFPKPDEILTLHVPIEYKLKK